MNIKVEKLPKSRAKLTVEVSQEKVAEFFQQAYERLAPTVNIKGFRAGKAPKLMVLEAVGQNRFNSEALNIAIAQSYFPAITQEKLNPIAQPSIAVKQFKEGEDFIFEAEVDLVPKIELGDYQLVKIKTKSQNYQATDEEIEKIIRRLRYQAAQFKPTDQPATKGDRVEIDFEGYERKVKLENFCNKNYPLILGEGILVKGFEEKLLGTKKGEEKEFSLKIPSRVKGEKDKLVDFKVKIIDIKKVDLPEPNQDFAKKFGHGSFELLRKAISENIAKEKETQARMELEQKVLEALANKAKVEIPQCLVEQEVSRRITEIQQKMGPGWANFLEKSGKKITDLRKDLMPQAENSVKIGLMLGEFARTLGFAKGKPKDETEQREIVKKTIDKLIELVSK